MRPRIIGSDCIRFTIKSTLITEQKITQLVIRPGITDDLQNIDYEIHLRCSRAHIFCVSHR